MQYSKLEGLINTIKEIKNSNIEFELFPYQFFMFFVTGLWFPEHLSKRNQFIHKLYCLVLWIIIFLSEFQLLIHLSFNFDNLKMINLFILEVSTILLYKAFQIRRRKFFFKTVLPSFLSNNWINFKNFEEKTIFDATSLKIRYKTVLLS